MASLTSLLPSIIQNSEVIHHWPSGHRPRYRFQLFRIRKFGFITGSFNFPTAFDNSEFGSCTSLANQPHCIFVSSARYMFHLFRIRKFGFITDSFNLPTAFDNSEVGSLASPASLHIRIIGPLYVPLPNMGRNPPGRCPSG
jgi:hypothetical protein